MMKKSRLLLVAPLLAGMAGLVAAPTLAHAQWRGGAHGYAGGYHGGYHGGYYPAYRGGYYHRGYPAGAIVGGAILGLGAAAIAGSLLAPPPVYYAPPPVYYPPPPVYYAPY